MNWTNEQIKNSTAEAEIDQLMVRFESDVIFLCGDPIESSDRHMFSRALVHHHRTNKAQIRERVQLRLLV